MKTKIFGCSILLVYLFSLTAAVAQDLGAQFKKVKEGIYVYAAVPLKAARISGVTPSSQWQAVQASGNPVRRTTGRRLRRWRGGLRRCAGFGCLISVRANLATPSPAAATPVGSAG